MNPKHGVPPRWGLIVTLAAGLFLGACASTGSVTRTQQDELMSALEQYHKNVRWKRPELAAPLVVPERASEYRDWSEAFAEDVDVQDWRVRQYEFVSPITARVEVERTQYELRKLVQKKERVEQTWTYIEGVGWRLTDGF